MKYWAAKLTSCAAVPPIHQRTGHGNQGGIYNSRFEVDVVIVIIVMVMMMVVISTTTRAGGRADRRMVGGGEKVGPLLYRDSYTVSN